MFNRYHCTASMKAQDLPAPPAPRRDYQFPPVTESILVVDDYEELCEVASIILRRSGYRVLTANTGEKEKQIAGEDRDIDPLLTDVDLPVMSGDELAQWFRSSRPGVPVVFMSGSSLKADDREPRHFVEKPFIHLDKLLRTVRVAIDERPANLQLPKERWKVANL